MVTFQVIFCFSGHFFLPLRVFTTQFPLGERDGLDKTLTTCYTIKQSIFIYFGADAILFRKEASMRRRSRERFDALCEVRELVQQDNWAVLDVETIGLEPAEIIQWAAAAPDGTILGEGFVHPTRPITEGARAIYWAQQLPLLEEEADFTCSTIGSGESDTPHAL